MKLILLFGPQAVGKMTVGHELEKITGLKLFHNHMTIEMVSPFFGYSTPTGKRLVNLFREEIFKEVAGSDLAGIIFTFVWAFDDKKDWDYIEKVTQIFKDKGSEVYYVELEASTEERVRRNSSEYRLLHKPTKRDIATSSKHLEDSMAKHRLNSNEGELHVENYLRINNTNLEPIAVAAHIKEKFGL